MDPKFKRAKKNAQSCACTDQTSFMIVFFGLTCLHWKGSALTMEDDGKDKCTSSKRVYI
jgi:hypothetical protein